MREKGKLQLVNGWRGLSQVPCERVARGPLWLGLAAASSTGV
jgi:hypothetical protein